MTTPAAADRAAGKALRRDLRVAIAAERMKIFLHAAREFRPLLMAEVAGILAGLVEEIVVAGSAFHRVVVLMVEVNGEHRRPLDGVLAQTVTACRQRQREQAYKQRPAGHGYTGGMCS